MAEMSSSLDSFKRQPNESEDQWLFRQIFLNKYKNIIEEQTLLCYANIIVNMEFLGCRYPNEVEEVIKKLTEGLYSEYRSKRRLRLKRKFVSATTAAHLKFTSNRETRPVALKISGPLKHDDFIKILKDVIAFDEDNPFNSVRKTMDNHIGGEFSETALPCDQGYMYQISYNGNQIVKCIATNSKKAKSDAFNRTYRIFKNYCGCTLFKKASFYSMQDAIKPRSGNIDSSPNTTASKPTGENFIDHQIGSENIGFKMLKALGWTGGTLGSNSAAGIIDPISLQVKVGRRGLGEASCKAGANFDSKYFFDLLRNYKNSPNEFDLIFSPEFTKNERAELHKMASKLQLKTQSFGKEGDRQLVIKKRTKLLPHELKKRLMENDPFWCEIYELREPLLCNLVDE